MKTLQIGVENTIEYYRPSADVTCTKVEYYDTLNGVLLYTDSSPTNDETDASITTGATEGGYSLVVDAEVTNGYKYEVQPEVAGQYYPFEIDLISVSEDTGSYTVEVKYDFQRDIPSGGSVKGLRVTSAYTPADSTYRAVRAIFTMSDGKPYTDEYLLFKRFVRCPVSHQDIASRWSRIVNQEPAWQRRANKGWNPQIDEAWEQIVLDLYIRNIMVDTIVNPAILKPLVMCHVDRIITEMGIDTVASENRLERLNILRNNIDREMQKVLVAPLALDKNENNVIDNNSVKPLTLNFDKPIISYRYRQ